jgi:anti-anti-sigma factor
MSDALTPPPGRLEVTIETLDGGDVLVVLEGELDLASVEELERKLSDARAGAPERVIVDLGRLSFIDSSGLRTIVQADANARAAGIKLVLRPGGESIQRVFQLTGALDALHFETA